MKKFDMEVMVGIFLVIGLVCLAYLSVKVGSFQFVGESGYTLTAEFDKTGGLKTGAPVEIAGVEIGRVKEVTLDNKNYRAKVLLIVRPPVKIQEDAIASIKTKGLLGEKYVQISPGASANMLAGGGKIRDTESAVDIEELISKYAFGEVK
ncbi:MAG: outer membrane lipid asymmetry maintenance protein MlaD [Nitrospirae bacterium]|nr:outer membrane lipid asymmetry maintenance protein MlaD [Nitrospirota bacterium]